MCSPLLLMKSNPQLRWDYPACIDFGELSSNGAKQ